MTAESLLIMVNEGQKKIITKDDIFAKHIYLDHLMRIDRIFDKGYAFYINPNFADISEESSIFFRKSKFSCELNFGAKKVVNYFEEFKISLTAIAEHAELRLKRKLPVFTPRQNPKIVAQQLRSIFAPNLDATPKKLLAFLTDKLAEHNILVFQFTENRNKKHKSNIDGFYLNPNVIVVKKQPLSAIRKEIFILVHELGHYLLNEEEIEQLEIENICNSKLSAVEKWCNDFAYYFLSTSYDRLIEGINLNDDEDYHSLTRFYLSKEL